MSDLEAITLASVMTFLGVLLALFGVTGLLRVAFIGGAEEETPV